MVKIEHLCQLKQDSQRYVNKTTAKDYKKLIVFRKLKKYFSSVCITLFKFSNVVSNICLTHWALEWLYECVFENNTESVDLTSILQVFSSFLQLCQIQKFYLFFGDSLKIGFRFHSVWLLLLFYTCVLFVSYLKLQIS